MTDDAPFYSAPGDGQWARQANDTWFSIWDLAKPVISQIHGYAIAGATELASACDLVYVADDAEISYPVVRVMSPPDWQYHTVLLGMRRAMELMLTGDPITGIQAEAIGFANRSFPRAELDESVLAVAGRVAGVPSDLAQINKRSVHRAFDVWGARAAIRAGTELQALAGHTQHRRRASRRVARTHEGREPRIADAAGERVSRRRGGPPWRWSRSTGTASPTSASVPVRRCSCSMGTSGMARRPGGRSSTPSPTTSPSSHGMRRAPADRRILLNASGWRATPIAWPGFVDRLALEQSACGRSVLRRCIGDRILSPSSHGPFHADARRRLRRMGGLASARDRGTASPPGARAVRAVARRVRRHVVADDVRRTSAPAEAVDALRAAMLTFHPAGFRAMARAAAEDLRAALPSIDVPTLLIYGADDIRAPMAVADHLHQGDSGLDPGPVARRRSRLQHRSPRRVQRDHPRIPRAATGRGRP